MVLIEWFSTLRPPEINENPSLPYVYREKKHLVLYPRVLPVFHITMIPSGISEDSGVSIELGTENPSRIPPPSTHPPREKPQLPITGSGTDLIGKTIL